MKKTLPMSLGVVVVVLLVWILTKVANDTTVNENPGSSFWLEGRRVVQCSESEITLADKRGSQTHLIKDESWPDCSVFRKDAVMDFFLARGEKTHLLKVQQAAWWR
jgi:hypothetical protein